ncbi:MAG: hypothetical protein U5L96_06095 [Owenweeksia sp.]|nr:hypothetical protein [Owenweeksia sp.]
MDELKYSKLKVGIETKEGPVSGFLSDSIDSEEMAHYWGKEVTITGMLHHKPGGKSIIEIQRLYEPHEGDAYFSRKPKVETTEQQLERQLRERGFQNKLPEIVGKWPGD